MNHRLRIFLLLLFLVSLFARSEEDTRRIWPEEFLKAPAKQSKPAKKAVYKVATPKVVVDKVSEDTVVGVTIWRLRPSSNQPDAVTIDSENGKWVPERVEGNAMLSTGDRVRLSIEAARKGYLYVINREQYKDGSVGEPYLIFPTSRLTGGNNATEPGRVIEIPSQADTPPYFTLTPGRPDQIAEILSVLVTLDPLRNMQITDRPIKLSAQQVSEWETAWGKATGRLEMVNGVGKIWTDAERQAGFGSRLLKHEDPAPQTVYYNPEAKSGDPAFVNIDLRYGEK